jgi:hypothetical protein
MGSSHGRDGVMRFILGSVAEEVMRHATCPVLVIKASETEEQPANARRAISPVRTPARLPPRLGLRP